jgi:DNA-binding beta-propeller fold protein YncE
MCDITLRPSAVVRRGLPALFVSLFLVSCLRSHPDAPAAPLGPDSVEPGLPYLFKTCVSGAAKGQPFIRFDWGDGDTSVWCGPGETARYSHSWSDSGIFAVRAQAHDDRAELSEWSEPLSVFCNAPYPYRVTDSVYIDAPLTEAGVSQDGRFVYVANYFDASLSAVRTSDLQVTQIPFYYYYPWWGGGGGGRMVCSPDGKYVYASYYRADYLAVIRTANQTAVDSLLLEATVNCLTVSPDGRRLYAAVCPDSGYSAGFIMVVRLPDDVVEDTIFTLGANSSVSSMKVSPDGLRLYATDQGHGRICAIRLSDKSMEWQVPWAGSNSTGVLFLHPSGNQLYAIEHRGISVRDAQTGSIVDSIPLASDWTGDISPDGSYIYATCKDSAGIPALAVVGTFDARVHRFITMPAGLSDVTSSPDGRKVYLLGYENGEVYVLSR